MDTQLQKIDKHIDRKIQDYGDMCRYRKLHNYKVQEAKIQDQPPPSLS